jgi:hypothetical protein
MAIAPRRTGGGRVGAACVLVATGLAATAAIWDLSREWAVHRAEQAATVQGEALARGDVAGGLRPDLLRAPGGSSRADVYRALILARAAGAVRDLRRRAAMLAEATSLAGSAHAARGRWAEAALVMAYAGAVRDAPGAPGAGTLAWLATSYRDGRFLRSGGAWRAESALSVWDRLPPDTRIAAIEEAVWIARLSRDVRPRLFELARQSGAYVPFNRRWIAARRADADLVGTRPAP